jgi:hypothetical protein
MPGTKSHRGDTEARRKAAKKGVKTRRANRATEEYHRKFVAPAADNLQSILTALINQSHTPVLLRWNPPTGSLYGRLIGVTKLKKGVEQGILFGFAHGYYLRVKPDGYKRPHVFHPAYWELIP